MNLQDTSAEGKNPDLTRDVVGVDVPRIVRLVVDEVVARAEQACRYAIKHQDFSESDHEFKAGWIVAANVCKESISEHVERHYESVLGKAIDSLPNAELTP